ncbi:hypothetical protein Bca101_077245 [Brassica carinata]
MTATTKPSSLLDRIEQENVLTKHATTRETGDQAYRLWLRTSSHTPLPEGHPITQEEDPTGITRAATHPRAHTKQHQNHRNSKHETKGLNHRRDTRRPHAPGLAAGDLRSETQNSRSKLRWGSPCRREKRNEGEKNRWNTQNRREEEKRGNPATANGGAAAGKARRLGYGKVGEERGKREGREKNHKPSKVKTLLYRLNFL